MFPLAPLLVSVTLHAVAPASGPLVEAEGFSFRAPAGFRVRAQPSGSGPTAYGLESGAEPIMLRVRGYGGDGRNGCAAQEGEVLGFEVEGARACALAEPSGDPEVVMGLFLVEVGDRVVTIRAMAPTARLVAEAGIAVALSVRGGKRRASAPGAAGAPWLVGCFERGRQHEGSALDADPEGRLEVRSWFGGVEKIRCFERDGGFLERRTVTVTSPAGGAYRQSLHEGAWTLRGRVVATRLADGGEDEWEVAPLEGGLQLGQEPWRHIDLDPEALRGDGAEGGEDEEDPLTFDVEEEG